jgi:SAM-dependent methyltransferase
MRGSADRYYATLSERYDEKIRQLVPRYDEMADRVLDLVAKSRPQLVIDIGAGPGTLDATLLLQLPHTRLTALDASPAMVTMARAVLEPFGDRVEIVRTDVTRYRPMTPVDAVFSSLVLHNLTPPDREGLLADVRAWLVPRGIFIWADLVRLPNAAAQREAVAYRRRFALAAGCDPALVDENFRKEADEDHPMTGAQMVTTLERCGFHNARLVWTHDTFAVAVGRSGDDPPRRRREPEPIRPEGTNRRGVRDA